MSIKYKNFDDLTEQYQPLRFKVGFWQLTEQYPHFPDFLKPLAYTTLYLSNELGLKVTYFHARLILSTEARKAGDIKFLSHYIHHHQIKSEHASIMEHIWYRWLSNKYRLETNYAFNQLSTHKVNELPEHIHNYFMRWGYLLDVEPSFVDFIHGVESHEAVYCLNELQ